MRVVVLVFALTTTLPASADTWTDFVAAMQAGEVGEERLRPVHPSLLEPMGGFVALLQEHADWSEWSDPERFAVDDRELYVLPLTLDGGRATYCFSFLVEEEQWWFHHLETISIRLDQLGELPAASFPDVDEGQKAWIRAENAWTRNLQLLRKLTEDEGRDAAFDWFRDGDGYALSAKTWVPFVSAERAFVLYLCWEQANLQGSAVTLVQLDDEEAVVEVEPLYLALYSRTAHFRNLVQEDDYLRLYEVIWQDRARAGGWDLDLQVDGERCVMRFTRGASSAPGSPASSPVTGR